MKNKILAATILVTAFAITATVTTYIFIMLTCSSMMTTAIPVS